MPLPLNPNLAATIAPPVVEARRWLAETPLPDGLPLLNLSQAAPVDPPPPALRQAMADAILSDDAAHLYGPVLGLPELRETLAARWTEQYGGTIAATDTAITSRCNQAFCVSIQSLAEPGDNVILPLPFYFNHKMWLDMLGIEARLAPPGAGLVPDLKIVQGLMDARTRAIVFVTPNNPTGVEYPDDLMRSALDLARDRGVALIVDETYRDFHSRSGPPHGLFTDPHWRDTLIHLYSFSKVFRLTGHRIGALIAAPERLAQIEKLLDSTTICPSQIGQRAALFGLRHMADWVAEERLEILRRLSAIEAAFDGLEGWDILGAGAYFAYVRHPFEAVSSALAPRLLAQASLLKLPGTMFASTRAEGGDGLAETTLRIAFANADESGIADLADRLRQLGTA